MFDCAFTNATLYTGQEILAGYTLLIKNGLIADIAVPSEQFKTREVHDCIGLSICPGLLDLQVYGGGGAMFSDNPTIDTLHNLLQHNLRHGTTGFLATMPTNSSEQMTLALTSARQFKAQHPDLVFGLHLEGPFISAAKRGAHPEEYIQQPDEAALEYWLREGADTLKMMTLAPECIDLTVLQSLANRYPAVLSAGHSNATYGVALKGFDSGFRAATHLFNAMSAFGHREPGLVGAIFDHPAVRVSAIADGVHVDFAALRIAKKILGERMYLITDAVDDAGTGPYQFFKKDNHYVNAAGVLAGSALTMPMAIRNCVQHNIAPLDEAIRMATLYPAEVLGLRNRGRLALGNVADLCIFAGTMESVSEVWANGRAV